MIEPPLAIGVPVHVATLAQQMPVEGTSSVPSPRGGFPMHYYVQLPARGDAHTCIQNEGWWMCGGLVALSLMLIWSRFASDDDSLVGFVLGSIWVPIAVVVVCCLRALKITSPVLGVLLSIGLILCAQRTLYWFLAAMPK